MSGTVDVPPGLARARSAHQPGSRTPHTVVMVPSYSVGDSLLAHYGHRIPALEHRHLLSLLTLPRVPAAQIIFVTSLRPARQVLDYYLSLVPPESRRDMRARIRILEVRDSTARSVTAKLLDRPDLMARIRRMTRGRLAYIDPWNVTPIEMELGRRLRLPLNGTAADLWPLGFKSNGRALMKAAGVPVPLGCEDVRSVDDVVAAAEAIRREHPRAAGVVVKSDNSGTGDGNRVIHFAGNPAGHLAGHLAGATSPAEVRRAVESLDPWFLADIGQGAVVEELVVGSDFASPSVQVDIGPDRRVEVLSTHEQLLGGANGQVYLGCRFPANPRYGTRLAEYGEAVGHALAQRGALGRLCVDFVAVGSDRRRWDVYGLEINLRKSGTTHPFSALAHLAPGRYDVRSGRWSTADGSERCYRSTDNLVDPAWHGRQADDVINAVRTAGLEFDPRERTGVVLHMFSGLDIDGRLGLTAIGTSPAHAEEQYETAVAALSVRAHSAGVPSPA